jgi:hypothetical protein
VEVPDRANAPPGPLTETIVPRAIKLQGPSRPRPLDLVSYRLAPVRLQVAHRGLQIGVAHPRLYGSQVYAFPQMPRSERGPELVQPEIAIIQLRALGDRLAALQEVQLGLAASGGKEQRDRVSALWGRDTKNASTHS